MKRPIARTLLIAAAGCALILPGCTRTPSRSIPVSPTPRGAEYYVATDGNDANPGTATQPFATLAHAATLVQAGDTIRLYGGTYENSPAVRLTQSGAEKAPIRIWAVEREHPVLDFDWRRANGILIEDAAWWHIKGLTLTHSASKGIQIQGENAHHNRIEAVTAFANGNSGFQATRGAHDNLLINCDSYENYDYWTYGQNADGFGLKFDIGEGNRLVGCRAWHNADDGYDCWYAAGGVVFEQCYAWGNGVNLWHDDKFEGNGNGFKLGQLEGAHTLWRCAAWDQPQRGFDLNGNSTGVTVEQCTAIRCRVNFGFGWPRGNAEKNVLRNNLSFQGEVEIDEAMDNHHNSWNMEGVEIKAEDFESVDPSFLEGPRKDDGSLPEGYFLRLSEKSRAIDAGTDLGRPFSGKAPDLGAFERPAAKTDKANKP
ncbi:right-handed parallel beta-helix repeat-containing protein [Candidatus Sumerlaeota bacterium]|nr:right-handed parallel beta-helix repeat-containing protein [Candidatus Sumerlaeota bacterium]